MAPPSLKSILTSASHTPVCFPFQALRTRPGNFSSGMTLRVVYSLQHPHYCDRFFPSANPAASEEILLWFNGGPGCSSLSGLLTENGPFTWEAGTKAPTQNPYTWVNLTNVMWVEQPVGVGYSQGVPNITNEVELGQEFIGFFKSFVDAFDIHGYKVYLTGESYGGYYIPYIADAFINADDTDYYNIKGVAINDPIIGDGTAQQEGNHHHPPSTYHADKS